MNRAICDLTIRGIKGKKNSSLLFAMVVFLSFAFALATLSVASSMEKSNREYRFDTYGEWYGALLFGKETDCDYLESREWLDTLGTMMCYGKISSASGEAAIGTVDEGLLDIGRIMLLDGTLPTAEDEIAMEADLLSELGYDYTVGQEVTLMVEFDSAAEEGFLSGNDVAAEDGSAVEGDLAAVDEPVTVEKTYTLTGIIREYADLWSFPEAGTETILAGAVVTPEAADALWEEAEALAKDNGQKPEGAACHLFFTVREGMEEQMVAEMESYLTDGNADGGTFSVNQAAYGDVQDAVYNTAYTVMILAVTLLSVLCLYLISFEGEVRRIALFRSIGITKKQLCTMLFYETAFLSVPAMALGAAAGSVGTWLFLHVALRSVTSSAYMEVPIGKVLVAAVLWLIGVFAARLAVYAAALRQPLTGRMYRAHKKIKRNRRMKNGMVVMLSALFCGTAVFTVLESLYPLSQIRFWGQRPSYLIHAGDAVASVSAGESPQLITDEIFNDLSGIPGVTETIPVATLDAHLQFTGMEDIALVSDLTEMEKEQGNGITCRIFAVQEEYWEDFFSLEETGIDTDAFRAGEEVILAFPADLDGEVNWQGQQYADTGITADRSVNISLSGYAVDGSEIGRKKEIGNISITVGGTALYADGDIR
ncbi:MAG: ABC transporter permease [Clostridiales bacterium]|nr:ABC transporter permease [Clostridiales bacterium]